MSDRTKYFFAAVALIVLALGTYYFNNRNKLEAHQFIGNVVSIKGSIISVKGVYWDKDKTVGPAVEPKEVEIEVREKTLIEKETFRVPDTNEVFFPDKLPKETTTVNISNVSQDSLNSDIGLVVQADANIYNMDKFTAAKITYRVPIFSEPK